MSKRKFLLPCISLLVAGIIMGGVTSCGEPTTDDPIQDGDDDGDKDQPGEETKVPSLLSSYVLGERTAGAYGDSSWNALTYQVNFYEENVYQYIQTEIQYGYSMVLGTTVKVNYGTYAAGASEDGVTKYTLNKASEVILGSFSLAGGFSISINTQNQTYPVEMPAKVQGEKNMAEDKDDVLNYGGLGVEIYCDATNTFSFVNPNDDSSEPNKSVTTASDDASVAKLLVKEYDKFGIQNELVSPGSYGDSSWIAKTHTVLTYTDGSYELYDSEVTYGYSMVLGTTTNHTVGEYTKGTAEDGYTKYDFKAASDVLLNSYSKAGGYNISIDTRNCEYPVEMPAKVQGEKNMAEDKDDVIAQYGVAKSYYMSDSSVSFALTDPNA